MIEAWQAWLALAIFLLALETIVPGFVLGSLALGAFLTALLSVYIGDWIYQLSSFSIGTLLSLVFLRPLVLKALKNADAVKTNVDAMIGRTAKVTHTFDPNTGKGRVEIDGVIWLALLMDPAAGQVRKGDIVRIERIEGNTLYVTKPKSQQL